LGATRLIADRGRQRRINFGLAIRATVEIKEEGKGDEEVEEGVRENKEVDSGDGRYGAFDV
jgi:hypothetical protein